VRLTTAILCDYAQVRNGLLYVVAGGVNQLVRTSFPAPMNVALAVVIEMDGFERQVEHRIAVHIVDPDGKQLATGQGLMRPRAPSQPIAARSQLPHVFDLRAVKVPGPGAFDVKVYVDDAHQVDVGFQVIQPASGAEAADTGVTSPDPSTPGGPPTETSPGPSPGTPPTEGPSADE